MTETAEQTSNRSQMFKHEDFVEWAIEQKLMTADSGQAETIAVFAANRNDYRKTDRYRALVEAGDPRAAEKAAAAAAAKAAKTAEREAAAAAKAEEKAAAKAAKEAEKPAKAEKDDKPVKAAAKTGGKAKAKASAGDENPFG